MANKIWVVEEKHRDEAWRVSDSVAAQSKRMEALKAAAETRCGQCTGGKPMTRVRCYVPKDEK